MENPIAPNPKTAYIALHDPLVDEFIGDVLEMKGYKVIRPSEELNVNNFREGYNDSNKDLVNKFLEHYVKSNAAVTIMDVNYPFEGSPNEEHLKPFLGAYNKYLENPKGRLFMPITGHVGVEDSLQKRGITCYSKPLHLETITKALSELEQKL